MHLSMDCSALCFEQQCTLANSRVHSYRFVHSLAWETLGKRDLSFKHFVPLLIIPKTWLYEVSFVSIHAKDIRKHYSLHWGTQLVFQILLISLLPFQSLLVWNIFHFYKCEWILEKCLAMCYQQILKLSVCGGKIENFIASLCDWLGRWALIKIGRTIHLSLDLVGLHAFIGIGRKIHLRGLWLILALNSLSSFPLHWIWSKSDKYPEI